MKPEELKFRNRAMLKAVAVGSIIPAILIYLLGPASLMAAPVFFVMVTAVVRANILGNAGLGTEVY